MQHQKFREFIKSVFLLEDYIKRTFTYEGFKVTFAQIQRAVENLPARQREAFELVVIKGMLQDDAAKEMGVKQPNVMRYVNFACEKLKLALFGEGVE